MNPVPLLLVTAIVWLVAGYTISMARHDARMAGRR